jgi:hypothetical protein
MVFARSSGGIADLLSERWLGLPRQQTRQQQVARLAEVRFQGLSGFHLTAPSTILISVGMRLRKRPSASRSEFRKRLLKTPSTPAGMASIVRRSGARVNSKAKG